MAISLNDVVQLGALAVSGVATISNAKRAAEITKAMNQQYAQNQQYQQMMLNLGAAQEQKADVWRQGVTELANQQLATSPEDAEYNARWSGIFNAILGGADASQMRESVPGVGDSFANLDAAEAAEKLALQRNLRSKQDLISSNVTGGARERLLSQLAMEGAELEGQISGKYRDARAKTNESLTADLRTKAYDWAVKNKAVEAERAKVGATLAAATKPDVSGYGYSTASRAYNDPMKYLSEERKGIGESQMKTTADIFKTLSDMTREPAEPLATGMFGNQEVAMYPKSKKLYSQS